MRETDDGFTLIELMVVVLVIAVLIAIAIPTFLGARSRSQDRRAQSNARTGFVNAKTLYNKYGNYGQVTATELAGDEPALTFVDATTSSANDKSLSVGAVGDETFIVSVYSLSGTCFWMRDHVGAGASGGTRYAKATSNGTDCKASSAPATFVSSW